MIIQPNTASDADVLSRSNPLVVQNVRRVMGMDYLAFLSSVDALADRFMVNEVTTLDASRVIVAIAGEPQTTQDGRAVAMNLHAALGERATAGLKMYTADSLPGRLRADGRALLAITFPHSGKDTQYDGQMSRLMATYGLPLHAVSPTNPDPAAALKGVQDRISTLAAQVGGGIGYHKKA